MPDKGASSADGGTVRSDDADVANGGATLSDDNGLDDDCTLMVRAATGAAALAMDYFSRGGVAAWDKSPGNPVTAADLAVDAQLKAELLGGRPGYGWLSEETVDDATRLARRRVWVVDPIDGTRDFIRGRTGWAVSVALVEAHRVIMGVLAAPTRGQVIVAVRARGATLNGVPMRVSGRTDLAGCSLPVDPSSLAASFWPEHWDAVAVEKPNSLALRIAHVASGFADGFIEGRTVAEWDVAAAVLILNEAGGTITDRDGEPMTFNQPIPRVHGIVAATPTLHDDLRRRLEGGLKALAARRHPR